MYPSATLGTGLGHRNASIRLARSTYHQAPERLSLTWLMNLLADSIPPQSRVVGGTFEFSFTLPKAANRSNPNGRKNKAENGGHQKATHAAKGENACPTPPATDSTALKTPSKPRASLPALEMRQERELPLRAENRKHRKALGLCKDCSNKAIPGQSRCPDCAGKNRQRHRAKEH